MTRAGGRNFVGYKQGWGKPGYLKKIQLGVFFGWVSLFFLLDAGCLLGFKILGRSRVNSMT
jgi:hypothetical protein